MRYYKLAPDYLLRGWAKLPWAVVKRPTNETEFISRQDFELLSLCSGKIDFDLSFFSAPQRARAEELTACGVLICGSEPSELEPYQRYLRYPNRYIRAAHWSVTGKCNYRCKHCFMSAPDAKLGELCHETVMDIARQIVACGIGTVSLTGGEPLVRADFTDIAEYLVKNGVYISEIYSNGALVNRELLAELKALGVQCSFNMSYDGPDGRHDWLRGIRGAERAVLRAFDLCREMGFETGSEMCIHRGNMHLLRQSVNTLAAHGCGSLKTNPVMGTELWARYDKDYSISTKELFDLYLDYIPRFFEDGMPLYLHLGGFFTCEKGSADYTVPSLHNTRRESFAEATVCGHARQTLYISPEGRMLPCMPLSSMAQQSAYPLVQDIGLANGLTDSAYMRLIDTRMSEYFAHNPACAECEYKYKCGGGCRASALSSSADILAPDKASCLMYKGGYAEKAVRVADAAIHDLRLSLS